MPGKRLLKAFVKQELSAVGITDKIGFNQNGRDMGGSQHGKISLVRVSRVETVYNPDLFEHQAGHLKAGV